MFNYPLPAQPHLNSNWIVLHKNLIQAIQNIIDINECDELDLKSIGQKIPDLPTILLQHVFQCSNRVKGDNQLTKKFKSYKTIQKPFISFSVELAHEFIESSPCDHDLIYMDDGDYWALFYKAEVLCFYSKAYYPFKIKYWGVRSYHFKRKLHKEFYSYINKSKQKEGGS